MLVEAAFDLARSPLPRASDLLNIPPPLLVEVTLAGVIAPLDIMPRNSLAVSPNPPKQNTADKTKNPQY